MSEELNDELDLMLGITKKPAKDPNKKYKECGCKEPSKDPWAAEPQYCKECIPF